MRPLNIRRDYGIKCGCIPNIKSTPFWWAWLRNSAGLRCAHTFQLQGLNGLNEYAEHATHLPKRKALNIKRDYGIKCGCIPNIKSTPFWWASQISNPLLFGEHGCEIVLACAVRILFSFKAWTVFNKGHGGATHDYRDEQTRWILSGIIMDLIF